MGAKVEASREEGSGGLTKVWLRRESLSEPSTGICWQDLCTFVKIIHSLSWRGMKLRWAR